MVICVIITFAMVVFVVGNVIINNNYSSMAVEDVQVITK